MDTFLTLLFGFGGWLTFAISLFWSRKNASRVLANGFRRKLEEEKQILIPAVYELKNQAGRNNAAPTDPTTLQAAFRSFIKICNEAEMAAECVQEKEIRGKNKKAITEELTELYETHITAFDALRRCATHLGQDFPNFTPKSYSAFYAVVEAELPAEKALELQREREQLGLGTDPNSLILAPY